MVTFKHQTLCLTLTLFCDFVFDILFNVKLSVKRHQAADDLAHSIVYAKFGIAKTFLMQTLAFQMN